MHKLIFIYFINWYTDISIFFILSISFSVAFGGGDVQMCIRKLLNYKLLGGGGVEVVGVSKRATTKVHWNAADI